MIRTDAALKVAGTAEFGVDLERPRMVFGALVLAGAAHARIRSLDLSGARAAPGVVAVVGPAEARAVLPRPNAELERPVFPETEVIYRHQPVAAVAAESLEAARAAARRVRLELEALPVRADLDSVFPDWPGSEADPALVNAHVHGRWGDVDGEFERADRIRRDVFRTSGVLQVPLEPHACLAEVRDGSWHVTTSTQSPFGTREDASDITGIPPSSLVVEGTWVGGGFGGKASALLEPYALVLAAAADRPVRLALSYREEFQLTRSTLPARIWLESAVRGGRMTARRARLLLDTGASLPGRDFATGYAIGFLLGPYRLDAFEVEGYAVRTHKPPFGPHRAPFAPQCVFAADSHMDALAREIGVDPIAFRLAQVWREGDSTAFGQRVGPFAGAAMLEAAGRLRDTWRAELPPEVGVGLGIGFWSTSTGAGGESVVVLAPDGARLLVAEREIGSGSVIRGLVAVAERALGLPAAAIRVEYLDTASAPFDSGVFGSRTLGALGRAVLEGSAAALAELARRTGVRGGVTLSWSDGAVGVVAGGRARPLEELLTAPERAAGDGVRGGGRHFGEGGAIDPRRALLGDFYPYTDFTASVHLAAVRVDPGTGSVEVERYAAFQDAGVVVDPATFRAQVEGGVAMGLGTALTEESLWGPDGRLENPGLLDYRVPTLLEVPRIEVHPVEGFLGAGPYGAKGIGEPPIIPVAAAVANAVAEATGARLTELPLTPERVARALKG